MKSFLLQCQLAALALYHVTASPIADSSSATPVLKSLGVDTTKVNVVIGNAASTCKILDILFPKNETFTSASPSYTPLVDVPWSEVCWLEPACFVTPKNAKEVSVIMRVLDALQTKFALRSGGHKSAPGFNSVGSDGVLVDLHSINKKAISSDKKTVTVGTGNRWRDVYSFVESHNMLVAGGRVPMVGVGGFMLGGGFSIFPSTWGLALDRVSRFQVVLPDGSIVDALPSGKYADLFHALKGGMSNFGVVTEFDLIPVPLDGYFGIKQFAINETNALLGAFGDYLANPSTDPKTSVQINLPLDGSLRTFFHGYAEPTPTAPKDFAKLPGKDLIPPTNGSLGNALSLGEQTTTYGNWYGVSYSHKVLDGKLLQETYALVTKAQAQFDPKTAFLTYNPQGVLPNLAKVGQSFNGGNVLGIQPVPQVWVDLWMTYSSVQDTPRVKQVVDDLLKQIEALIQKENVQIPYIFPSTASVDQKPLDGFGAQNLATIRAAAKKYDPKGVMQKLQNDGYLISNS